MGHYETAVQKIAKISHRASAAITGVFRYSVLGSSVSGTSQGAAPMNSFFPPPADLIRVGSRRWFLQTGISGVAGLSLPALLVARAHAAGTRRAPPDRKAVIVFWLSGGPSHIDMWDPKPDAPVEIRSPFASLPTKLAGVHFTEHLPLQ